MGFNLLWVEEDIENASSDYSYGVAEALEKSLKEKERQVKWCRTLPDLSKRFHNVFGLDGLQVAEIRFSSHSAEYRALCIVLPESDSVVYYATVPKKGSYQERRLRIMRENAEEIRETVRQLADGASS